LNLPTQSRRIRHKKTQMADFSTTTWTPVNNPVLQRRGRQCIHRHLCQKPHPSATARDCESVLLVPLLNVSRKISYSWVQVLPCRQNCFPSFKLWVWRSSFVRVCLRCNYLEQVGFRPRNTNVAKVLLPTFSVGIPVRAFSTSKLAIIGGLLPRQRAFHPAGG